MFRGEGASLVGNQQQFLSHDSGRKPLVCAVGLVLVAIGCLCSSQWVESEWVWLIGTFNQ